MARKKVNAFIDEALWRRLRASCAILDKPVSAEIERMICRWLAENEPTARKRMDRSAVEGTCQGGET